MKPAIQRTGHKGLARFDRLLSQAQDETGNLMVSYPEIARDAWDKLETIRRKLQRLAARQGVK
jgi:hypothetical protein